MSVKEGEKEVEKDKVLEGEWILIDDSFEKEGEYYVIKQSITENCRIEIIVEDAVGKYMVVLEADEFPATSDIRFSRVGSYASR